MSESSPVKPVLREIEVKAFGVHAWPPENAPPTQVQMCLIGDGCDVMFIVRMASVREVDRVIEMLRDARDRVWPEAPRPVGD